MVAIPASSVRKTIAAPLRNITGYLLYGSDSTQIGARAHDLAHSLKLGSGGGNIVRLHDSDIAVDPDRITIELTTRSLFGGQTVVWLTSCPAKAQTILLDAVSEPLQDSLLIVQAPDLKKSHKLTQAFETGRHLAAIACYGEDQADYNNDIRDRLRVLGHDADADAIAMIADRSDQSSALMKTELEKLSAFAGTGARITSETVAAILSEQQTAETFDVIDAALDGDGRGAVAAFERMIAEDHNITPLILMLIAALQCLHALRLEVDSGAGAAFAVKQLRPPVFFKQQDTLTRQVRLWPAAQLNTMWVRCNHVMKETRLRPAFAEALTLNMLIEIAKTAKSLIGRG